MSTAAPQKKAKGPIRFEAIIPFAIVVGLIILYFTLFFDTHLRKGLEWAGTQANGAEVNIADVDTSFWKATLAIKKIEVTNREEPKKNRAEVGDVRFGLLWDALLRAKVVVTEASITGIETNTDRKSPGRVLPPAKEGSLAAEAISKLKEEIGKTSIGDFAKFLEGFDPTKGLKELGELKSAARIAELRKSIDEKEKQWNQSLASLPSQADFQALTNKLNGLAAGAGGNPAEVLAKVNEAQGVLKEGEAKIASVQKMGDTLTSDVTGFTKSVAEVDDLAAQDRKNIESKLKIPSVDPKQIAMQLFGNTVLDKVGKVQRYVDTARAYLPPKKKGDKPEEKVVIQERAKGHDYEFGRPNSYPKFWLRHAKISSKGEHSAFGGDVEGTLDDVSSNPRLTGKPSVLKLMGDFPKQNIGDVLFRGEMDHTGEIPKESFQASVGSYPVGSEILSDSESLKFGFNQAKGAGTLEGSLQGDQIKLSAASTFREVDYLVTAQSKLLQDAIQGVVKEIPVVDMKATLKGSWAQPDLTIESNLAQALGRGLEKQLQAKIAEARQKIDQMIQGNISKAKADLNARVNDVKTKVTSQVEERKKQASAFRAQADAKINEIKAKASPQNKAVEGLKKKLPF